MAQHEKQPSSALLWAIVPIATALTILFMSVNGNVAPVKEGLPGALPAKKEMVKHEEHATEAHADTTHAAADTTHAVEAHAAEGVKEVEHTTGH